MSQLTYDALCDAAAPFDFSIKAEDGAARVAEYRTPHGVLNTPAFVAVGTRSTVKVVISEQVKDSGTQPAKAKKQKKKSGDKKKAPAKAA